MRTRQSIYLRGREAEEERAAEAATNGGAVTAHKGMAHAYGMVSTMIEDDEELPNC